MNLHGFWRDHPKIILIYMVFDIRTYDFTLQGIVPTHASVWGSSLHICQPSQPRSKVESRSWTPRDSFDHLTWQPNKQIWWSSENHMNLHGFWHDHQKTMWIYLVLDMTIRKTHEFIWFLTWSSENQVNLFGFGHDHQKNMRIYMVFCFVTLRAVWVFLSTWVG